jgi:hypothetical protein
MHKPKKKVRVTRFCFGNYMVHVGSRSMDLAKVEGRWILTDDALKGEATTVMVGDTKAGIIEALEAEARQS